MINSEINIFLNEDFEYKDTQKQNKIKVVNDLVKNYCLLKELNLLSTIKNEENEVIRTKKDIIYYNSKNIIYANKYIMDFLQLRKQNKLKLKEEKKRKEKRYEKILNEKDIINIIRTLNRNGLNISAYEKNIMNYDQLNNFRFFNNNLCLNYIDIPTINDKSFHIQILHLLKLLINNYNASLNLIKIQQNVINDFTFYTQNLLMNNKKLIEKNENLFRNNSAKIELKSKLPSIYDIQIKFPFTCEDNLSSLFRAQSDLYRRHINYLYNQNDDLKNILNVFNLEDISSNN